MATERLQRRIDRLLDQIDEAVELKDWVLVLDHSKDVLALDPDNVDAKAYLAAAERRLNDSDQATDDDTPLSEPIATSASFQEQPTSFANGRYSVTKFLGEGGKKRVYLAQDTLLDRDVAFALIKTRAWTTSLAPASLEKLKRWGDSVAILTS